MIGTEWQAPRGLRKIEGTTERDGRTYYLVRTGDNRFCDLLTESDLASEQRRDAANVAFRAKAAADRAECERQEAMRIAADPLEQFLATLPVMKAGRARKSLTMLQRINGGPAATRARNVQSLIEQGYSFAGDRVQREGDQAYFSARDFTSYGIAFAQFLNARAA